MQANVTNYQHQPLEGGGGPDRYPRLQVDYGRIPDHIASAADHDLQEDTLVALFEACWPQGRWVECFVICDPSAGWLS